MDDVVAKAKEQMLRNRLALAKGVAITATVVAAYYVGRTRGAIVVKLYPRNPIDGIDPVGTVRVR